jgi:hypothetical protein
MFDQIPPSVFLQQGILGVVCLILLYALQRVVKRYDQVQERRISEGLTWQSVLRDHTELVRELTETQRTQNTIISALSESQRATAAAMQAAAAQVSQADASVRAMSGHIAQLTGQLTTVLSRGGA